VAGKFFRVEGARSRAFTRLGGRRIHRRQIFHVPEAFGALVFTEAGGKIGASEAADFFLCLRRAASPLFVPAWIDYCFERLLWIRRSSRKLRRVQVLLTILRGDQGRAAELWLRLTPELMCCLSGGTWRRPASLQFGGSGGGTHAGGCGWRLSLRVAEIGAGLKSGTAVCRIITPTGTVSFELPLSAREQTIHKFQG